MAVDPYMVLQTEAGDGRPYPQPGRARMLVRPPIAVLGTGSGDHEAELTAQLDDRHVFMMGDNPRLPRMPEAPTLLDFFRLRLSDFARRHLLQSAKLAREAGHDETVVLACLLHDLSAGAFLRSDHGYWAAQLIGPYVSEEIAWAVSHHQALRYFADESVGYTYPAAYERYFGTDYEPPAYIRQAAEEARRHKWYMTARLITINDIYAFDDSVEVSVDEFTDLVGRHFRQPREGLGFDGSDVAHMWRTMIWPNNFL
jgi:hypothetical protein